MSEILSLVISLLPYFAAAVVAALLIGATSRWIVVSPQSWLIYAVLLLTLPASLGGGDSSDGSLFKQLTWSTLFFLAGLSALGITQRRFEWPVNVAFPWALATLISYALISVLWSPAPLVSAKRGIQIVGVLFLAVVLVKNSSEQISLRNRLLLPVIVFMLLGLGLSVVYPSNTFDGDALKAMTSHKNTWGQFSLLTCLVLLFSIRKDEPHKNILICFFIIAFTSLMLTKSTTSIFSFLLILSIFLIASLARAGNAGLISFYILLIISALATLVFTIKSGELPLDWLYESFFRLTDKSQNLTGRHFLWQLMSAEIERHKWFGIGFGGFWIGLDGPSSAIISRLNWGPPSQAHSGYLDLTNELGIVGIIIFTLLLLNHIKNLFFLWQKKICSDIGFHASLLLAALIINYAETSFLRTTHLLWIILCISIVEVNSRLKSSTKDIAP